MKDIKIIVAAHKPYEMPADAIYLPLQVGAAGKSPITEVRTGARMRRDDTGDNISAKNPKYSELTGLYWAWKNLSCDYCGLVHYRRHFVSPGVRGSRREPLRNVLDREHLTGLLARADAVLPKRRRYYIETIASHYAHTHEASHLDVLREVMHELQPGYEQSLETVLNRRSAHMFNMLILRKDLFDAYCAWLFPILSAVTERIDDTDYDAFSARYPGRLSEFLPDVWLEHNKIRTAECPTKMLGRVRWGRKLLSFLGARFFGKSYRSSF